MYSTDETLLADDEFGSTQYAFGGVTCVLTIVWRLLEPYVVIFRRVQFVAALVLRLFLLAGCRLRRSVASSYADSVSLLLNAGAQGHLSTRISYWVSNRSVNEEVMPASVVLLKWTNLCTEIEAESVILLLCDLVTALRLRPNYAVLISREIARFESVPNWFGLHASFARP